MNQQLVDKFAEALEFSSAPDYMTDEEIDAFWRCMRRVKERSYDAEMELERVWKNDERLNFALDIVLNAINYDDKEILIEREPKYVDCSQVSRMMDRMHKKFCDKDENLSLQPRYTSKQEVKIFNADFPESWSKFRQINEPTYVCVSFPVDKLDEVPNWLTLISAFNVSVIRDNLFVRITIDPHEDNLGKWQKTIRFHESTWIPFSEKGDIPCDRNHYPLKIEFPTLYLDDFVVIAGIYIPPGDALTSHIKDILTGHHHPREYGFCFGLSNYQHSMAFL